jgi:hypothetical protein
MLFFSKVVVEFDNLLGIWIKLTAEKVCSEDMVKLGRRVFKIVCKSNYFDVLLYFAFCKAVFWH